MNPDPDTIYTFVDNVYRAPGHDPLSEGSTPGSPVLVGVYSGMPSDSDSYFENLLGPALTLGSSYYVPTNRPSNGMWNLAALDVHRIAEGRALQVGVASRMGSVQNDTFQSWATWKSISEGDNDADFIRWANLLKDLTVPVSFSLDIEPDTIALNGSLPSDGNWEPEHYAAAYRRIYGIMKAIAPNISIRWWIGGSNQNAWMQRFWPGGAYVDSIGVDPYLWAHNDPATTPTQKYTPFVNWVRALPGAASIPVGLSETGFDLDAHGDAAGAVWWSGLPTAVQILNLAFIVFFDRGEWVIDDSTPLARDAYANAMRQISGVQ